MNVWLLKYRGYNPRTEGLRETLCTVGNGYFATRGAAPESSADDIHYPGTYIAGCYDRQRSKIGDRMVENESLVNVPNWLRFTFKIGNEKNWFDLANTKILNYKQELDVRKGTLVRRIRFQDRKGRISRLIQTRLAHMSEPHLACLETKFIAENWSGVVKFLSGLDGRVDNSRVRVYRRFSRNHLVAEEQSVTNDGVMYLSVRTRQSEIKISEACRHEIHEGKRKIRVSARTIVKNMYVAQEFSVSLRKGKPLTVEKLVGIFCSKDRAISECEYAAIRSVSNGPSFSELKKSHEIRWKHLWQRFTIRVLGDDRAALALHIHIFHLVQTISLNSVDLDVSVPARGLQEAYRGHIFWDTLFIFPLLNIHIPALTRSMLMYRYRRMPEAKRAAKEMGVKGALFPWQSGSDGREETQVINLNPLSNRWMRDNTHLQWHVNAAIAYNIWSYYQVSQDYDFLSLYGAEMLLEIARFFGSIATFNSSKKRYEIRGVVGPDEFHDAYPWSKDPGLNNNAYTNIMAVWTLQRALEVLNLIPRSRRDALFESFELKREELSMWEDISRKMFVPFLDGEIISQFEGYEKLKELDWDAYRKKYSNIQRLDRVLEAEGDNANNYKVSKQADVLMLFYLFSSDELRELFSRLRYKFRREMIPKNIEYYIERTSHGSTLSRIVYSWVLARLNREESWQIAKEALESDLSDIQGGTTREGIHVGAMAGTVEIFQRCYMGLVTRKDILWLDPTLPKEISKIIFTFYYRGHAFDLEVTSKLLKIKSSQGPAEKIKVGFQGKVFEISAGESREFAI